MEGRIPTEGSRLERLGSAPIGRTFEYSELGFEHTRSPGSPQTRLHTAVPGSRGEIATTTSPRSILPRRCEMHSVKIISPDEFSVGCIEGPTQSVTSPMYSEMTCTAHANLTTSTTKSLSHLPVNGGGSAAVEDKPPHPPETSVAGAGAAVPSP